MNDVPLGLVIAERNIIHDSCWLLLYENFLKLRSAGDENYISRGWTESLSLLYNAPQWTGGGWMKGAISESSWTLTRDLPLRAEFVPLRLRQSKLSVAWNNRYTKSTIYKYLYSKSWIFYLHNVGFLHSLPENSLTNLYFAIIYF